MKQQHQRQQQQLQYDLLKKQQQEQQQQLKELKLVHRNQTIITSSSSDCDHDIPFDFSQSGDDNCKLIEPMEFERIFSIARNKVIIDKDVEMLSVDYNPAGGGVSNNNALTLMPSCAAVRPTTLNIPGPEKYTKFTVLVQYKCSLTTIKKINNFFC